MNFSKNSKQTIHKERKKIKISNVPGAYGPKNVALYFMSKFCDTLPEVLKSFFD